MAVAKPEKSPQQNVEGPMYYPVFKSDPFVNELLRILRPQHITVEDFDAIVDKNRQNEESIIRFAAIRKIDVTGLTDKLIEFNATPEKTLETLCTISAQQLNKIQNLHPAALREDVFNAMEGKETTLDGIRRLVRYQDDVMRILTEYRKKSPLAQLIREINIEAVRSMYRQGGLSSIFDNQITFRSGINGEKRLQMLHTGEPRICYVPFLDGTQVKYVDEYYFTPNLQKVILTGPIFDSFSAQDPSLKQFKGQSVGLILDAITPDVFKRENEHLYPKPDPRTLTGFAKLIGKGGSLFYRGISHWMTLNEQRHAATMKADETAAAVREFFTTHN